MPPKTESTPNKTFILALDLDYTMFNSHHLPEPVFTGGPDGREMWKRAIQDVIRFGTERGVDVKIALITSKPFPDHLLVAACELLREIDENAPYYWNDSTPRFEPAYGRSDDSEEYLLVSDQTELKRAFPLVDPFNIAAMDFLPMLMLFGGKASITDLVVPLVQVQSGMNKAERMTEMAGKMGIPLSQWLLLDDNITHVKSSLDAGIPALLASSLFAKPESDQTKLDRYMDSDVPPHWIENGSALEKLLGLWEGCANDLIKLCATNDPSAAADHTLDDEAEDNIDSILDTLYLLNSEIYSKYLITPAPLPQLPTREVIAQLAKGLEKLTRTAAAIPLPADDNDAAPPPPMP